MESVQDKIQRVLLLLQNLDLKFELQGKMVKDNSEASNKQNRELNSNAKNEKLLTNSRLQRISTEQGIDGSCIRRIHGDLASLKAIVSNDG